LTNKNCRGLPGDKSGGFLLLLGLVAEAPQRRDRKMTTSLTAEVPLEILGDSDNLRLYYSKYGN
jgi:hypothetical protein